MYIKTAEATGDVLDWLVAKCEGYNVGVRTREDMIKQQAEDATDLGELFDDYRAEPCFITSTGWKHTTSSKLAEITGCGEMRFSRNWAQGGQIIERAMISVLGAGGSKIWEGRVWDTSSDSYISCYGQTPLIAAMRCYVALKSGKEVDIPEDLINS